MSGSGNVRRVEHEPQNNAQHGICECTDPQQLRWVNAWNCGAVEVVGAVSVPTPAGAAECLAVALRASAAHAFRDHGSYGVSADLDKHPVPVKVLNVDLRGFYGG